MLVVSRPQALDYIEMFAGRANASRAFRMAGRRGISLDCNYYKCNSFNIETPAGMARDARTGAVTCSLASKSCLLSCVFGKQCKLIVLATQQGWQCHL